MKILQYTLLSALLSTAASAEPANGSVEAYSRIFRHRDGTRTESFKNGDKREIQEFTYNQNNVLEIKRMFVTDSKGRCRQGYIFDGKQNPLGSIEFGFDSKTDQVVLERLFNRKGQLIRELYYPGSIKKTVKGVDYGNRFVALIYDPNNPKAAPVQSKEPVAPTRPVESDQDEFEPGIPIGRSAPAANASTSSSTAQAPAPGPRKRFFGSPGSVTPPPAPPPPVTPPPVATPKAAPPAPAPAPAASPPAAKRVAPARKPQT